MSMFILLPLYADPSGVPSAWSNVTAAIAAYPKVHWQVIINPDSGPGTMSYPTDPNYIAGISKLNSYPNVITLGYVDTSYSNRAYSSVTSDIDVYASWASYTNANISIGGIFFDDVVGQNAGTNAVVTYYHNASAYAYEQVPSDVTPVVFNPGSLGPQQLFQYCDTMVEFESPLSSYQGVTTIKTIPSGYADQSAILVYNATATANVNSLVHTMAQNGVEAVYIDYGYCTYKGGITGCYNSFNLAYLKQLAAAVMAG
ncbi:hypothetical protein MMC28_003570 [Mycoblastus sanguinarius]|nr:hypothetical protein [Mycoblastus sanguinarius]